MSSHPIIYTAPSSCRDHGDVTHGGPGRFRAVRISSHSKKAKKRCAGQILDTHTSSNFISTFKERVCSNDN
jgi:hypothetical protein